MNWLTNFVKPKLSALVKRKDVPENLWQNCPSCANMLHHKDLKENLFALLSDAQPLEAVSATTEGDDPLQLIQSLIFVKGVEYGTRASSVIVIDHKGCASFFERTFNNGGSRISENVVQLSLKKGA